LKNYGTSLFEYRVYTPEMTHHFMEYLKTEKLEVLVMGSTPGIAFVTLSALIGGNIEGIYDIIVCTFLISYERMRMEVLERLV